MKKKLFPCVTTIILDACFIFSYAQENVPPQGASAEEVAKKLSNPVASLISVPLQNNTDYGIGNNNGVKNTLNIQPVIPFALNSKFNLVTRYIIPIVSQYDMHGEGTSQSGLSDATISAFIAPAESKIIWGAGPAFLIPIATDDLLGGGKFGLGPTALVAKQTTSRWTFGFLTNQIWSVAGDEDRADVNQLFFQPFIVHNWKSGAGVSGNFEITEHWNADSDPLIAYFIPNVSGVTKLGKQVVSIIAGPRIPLEGGDNVKPDWGWRAALTLVFPK